MLAASYAASRPERIRNLCYDRRVWRYYTGFEIRCVDGSGDSESMSAVVRQPPHVEAKLDRGRHLVDVLPAGPGRLNEALLDLALIDFECRGNPDHDLSLTASERAKKQTA